MRSRSVLWVSAGLILGMVTFAAAENDDQPELQGLLPEVSLAAAQPMLPITNNFAQVNQVPACGSPGIREKGCSETDQHTPPSSQMRREAKSPSFFGKTSGKPLDDGNRKSDQQKHLAPGMVLDAPVVLMPEMTTTVRLSASDLNRIICPTEVKEALTSDEKGLMIKITGKDVFVKYKVSKRHDGALAYSNTPTELFVVCGGSTYSMIAYPGRMPSQTIKLSSGLEDKIKENQSLFAGIPFEKRLMRVIKEVYTDNIPESYSVVNRREINNSWKSISIVSRREVDIEGEGIKLKEFSITPKPGLDKPFKLSEKMFLRKEFTINPVAVAIDKHILRPGETSRLFIIEQRPDKPLGGNGLMLPSMEGGPNASISTPSTASAPQASANSPSLLQNQGSTKSRSGAYQPQRTYMMN